MSDYWIRIGLDTGIFWPTEIYKVQFKGHEIELHPHGQEGCYPSLVFNCTKNQLTQEDAVKLCREFLSALSWVEDSKVIEVMHLGGSPFVLLVGGFSGTRSTNTYFEIEYLPEAINDQARLALALYREAIGLNSIPYQFLGYSKIINIIQNKGKDQVQWINSSLQKITEKHLVTLIDEIKTINSDVGDYLYADCRCAIAHAHNPKQLVNPDLQDDLDRLRKSEPIIKKLAVIAIEDELGIMSKDTFQKTKNQIEAIQRLIQIDDLKNDTENSMKTLINEIRYMSIFVRREEQLISFCHFLITELKYLSSKEKNVGIIKLGLKERNSKIHINLYFDYNSKKMNFDLQEFMDQNQDITQPDIQFDKLRFEYQMLCNGELMLINGKNGEVLVRSDPLIPVNIDLGASSKEYQHKIIYLEDGLRRIYVLPYIEKIISLSLNPNI
jgi:hypothetical protein